MVDVVILLIGALLNGFQLTSSGSKGKRFLLGVIGVALIAYGAASPPIIWGF